MNKTEVEWFREQEDAAYKHMQVIQHRFTRNSAEFREARAEWFTYHHICMQFDIPEKVQDNGSRT